VNTGIAGTLVGVPNNRSSEHLVFVDQLLVLARAQKARSVVERDQLEFPA